MTYRSTQGSEVQELAVGCLYPKHPDLCCNVSTSASFWWTNLPFKRKNVKPTSRSDPSYPLGTKASEGAPLAQVLDLLGANCEPYICGRDLESATKGRSKDLYPKSPCLG